ncbi:hypothetical protein ABKN59_004767 [Abortiporus biennis]
MLMGLLKTFHASGIQAHKTTHYDIYVNVNLYRSGPGVAQLSVIFQLEWSYTKRTFLGLCSHIVNQRAVLTYQAALPFPEKRGKRCASSPAFTKKPLPEGEPPTSSPDLSKKWNIGFERLAVHVILGPTTPRSASDGPQSMWQTLELAPTIWRAALLLQPMPGTECLKWRVVYCLHWHPE